MQITLLLNRNRFIVAVLLLIIGLSSLSFTLLTIPDITVAPVARQGHLDLRGWDFKTDGNVALKGEWAFFWRELIGPDAWKKRAQSDFSDSAFMPLPRTWNGYRVNGEAIAGDGFASYGLRVKIDDPDRIMSVRVKPMSTAYDLWINGTLVASNGKIGETYQTMTPQFRVKSVSFKPTGEEIEILLRISNFMHRNGGVWRAIVLGDSESIQDERDRVIAKDWVLSVTLMVLSLYHFVVFFQRRKEKAGFYLAGFCLFMALRVWLTGERFLYTVLENFHWEIGHKLEYITLMMAIPFFGSYFRSLFPDEFKAWVVWVINGVTTAAILTVLVTESRVYSWIIIPFEVGALLSGIYIIYTLIMAVAHGRKNARLILLGVLLAFFMGINDVLHVNQIIFTLELFNLGILLTALIQTLAMSRIFVNALENSEKLSEELANRNVILDESNRETEKRSRDLEQQLYRSQKLEAIGTLSGGIAHEFNNILGTMMGYIELMIDQTPEGGDEQSYLEQIYKSGERAAELVDQILTFSRKGPTDLKRLRLSLIVEEGLKLIRATLPNTIEIRAHIVPNCPLVLANETQIHQVLVNLCNNAAQAIGEQEGVLTIGLSVADIKADLFEVTDLAEGTYLKLTVKDTGIGMKSEVKERIFDPFYTTKGDQKGTGLGLSVVHGIVKNHSAEIMVDSSPGKGTLFTIYFPVNESEETVQTDKQDSPSGGQGRLLIVDDEEPLAKYYGIVLKKLGYDVTVVNSGIQALQLLRADPGQFDLVFTDQAMPRMSGLQFSHEIVKIRSDLPIILSTGYRNDDLLGEAGSVGIRAVINKPVRIGQLSQIIQDNLN